MNNLPYLQYLDMITWATKASVKIVLLHREKQKEKRKWMVTINCMGIFRTNRLVPHNIASSN